MKCEPLLGVVASKLRSFWLRSHFLVQQYMHIWSVEASTVKETQRTSWISRWKLLTKAWYSDACGATMEKPNTWSHICQQRSFVNIQCVTSYSDAISFSNLEKGLVSDESVGGSKRFGSMHRLGAHEL